MRVRIMRGIPGSGKSYFGSVILPRLFAPNGITICSADHFFIKDEVYRFDPKKLPYAHKACRAAFLKALTDGDSELVVVDNTNTSAVEIAFYYELATLFTNDVEILIVQPPATMEIKDWLDQCFKKNAHGVPMKSIISMEDRKKKKLPWFWKKKTITREDGHFVFNGEQHLV